MTKRDMSVRKRKFIAAMSANTTIEGAATASGVSKRTAMRYMRDPDVRAALRAEQDAIQSQVTGRMVAATGAALDTLEQIHLDVEAPTGSRVAAAKAILEIALRMCELSDITARIAHLEWLVDGDRWQAV